MAELSQAIDDFSNLNYIYGQSSVIVSSLYDSIEAYPTSCGLVLGITIGLLVVFRFYRGIYIALFAPVCKFCGHDDLEARARFLNRMYYSQRDPINKQNETIKMLENMIKRVKNENKFIERIIKRSSLVNLLNMMLHNSYFLLGFFIGFLFIVLVPPFLL